MAEFAGTVGVLGSSVMTVQKRDTELQAAIDGGVWELLLSTALLKSIYALFRIFRVKVQVRDDTNPVAAEAKTCSYARSGWELKRHEFPYMLAPL